MTDRDLSADFMAAQRFVVCTLPDDGYDCADFFLDVQRQIFNVSWLVPNKMIKHKRGTLGQIAQIKQAKELLAEKIDKPIHGCAVLIVKRDDQRDRWHIGTVFENNGEFWVLHTSEVMTGASLNRVNDFARLGQIIEGYYKCK